jgi:hypothetical protein
MSPPVCHWRRMTQRGKRKHRPVFEQGGVEMLHKRLVFTVVFIFLVSCTMGGEVTSPHLVTTTEPQPVSTPTRHYQLQNQRLRRIKDCSIIDKLDSVERRLSKSCSNDTDCISRPYVDSLTNAVKCFRRDEPGLADYDYIFEVYRDKENNCPLSLGGAPYSEAYCRCIEGACTPILVE